MRTPNLATHPYLRDYFFLKSGSQFASITLITSTIYTKYHTTHHTHVASFSQYAMCSCSCRHSPNEGKKTEKLSVQSIKPKCALNVIFVLCCCCDISQRMQQIRKSSHNYLLSYSSTKFLPIPSQFTLEKNV